MKKIIQKLLEIEKKLSHEKGKFMFFALFLRDDPNTIERWDLLVAADWIYEDEREAMKVIAKNVQDSLAVEEVIKLSGIVIIDKNDESLADLIDSYHIEHGILEMDYRNFFGQKIEKAYFITSQKTSQENLELV